MPIFPGGPIMDDIPSFSTFHVARQCSALASCLAAMPPIWMASSMQDWKDGSATSTSYSRLLQLPTLSTSFVSIAFSVKKVAYNFQSLHLFPHLGWIAARAPNRVNRAHGPTKENRQNLGNFLIFPAHGKNGPGGPQMGRGRFSPA